MTYYKNKKHAFLLIIGLLALIIVGAVAYFLFISLDKVAPSLGDVHKHADFKLYINNAQFNFSQEKYMSNGTDELSPFAHFHDIDGNLIHQHINGFTLGQFFKSLGMMFNSTCFALDNGSQYCNFEDMTLKMYLKHNGSSWQLNREMNNYEFQDLDRILITYGNDSQNTIMQQMNSVTDKACIQSGKCPERGNPENESSCLSGQICDATGTS